MGSKGPAVLGRFVLKSNDCFFCCGYIRHYLRLCEADGGIIVGQMAFFLKHHEAVREILYCFWKFRYQSIFARGFGETMLKSTIGLPPRMFASNSIRPTDQQISTIAG